MPRPAATGRPPGLRLTGGRWRGRRLTPPAAGQPIRPTAGRAREALFDTLAHADFGAGRGAALRVPAADICCGTGALGLEALSRGAPAVSFLDRDRAALALLRRNLAALDAGPAAVVLAGDATAPPPPLMTHGLILMDPPYADGIAPAALAALAAAGWLAPGAVMVLELPARPAGGATDGMTLASIPGIEPVADRRYGAARLLFLRAAGPAGDPARNGKG